MAARMEQLAPPGRHHHFDSTYREVEGYIETEPLGRQTFKERLRRWWFIGSSA